MGGLFILLGKRTQNPNIVRLAYNIHKGVAMKHLKNRKHKSATPVQVPLTAPSGLR